MKLISQYQENLLNAGPKAKKDVEKILIDAYNAKVYAFKFDGKEENNKLRKLFSLLKKVVFCFIHFRRNHLTVIQFPFINSIPFLKLLNKKIAYIHDLNGLREQNNRIISREIKALKLYDAIIAHNDVMKDYLVKKGIAENRIITLELFDYLCEFEDKKRVLDKNNLVVAYTGNLNKSPFINQIEEDKMNFRIRLYGVGNVRNTKKIEYVGKFEPDDVPNAIDCDLGLVWDGNYDESDEFETYKNYTKFNNPHKLSCYIAANIPVVVWEKSAIAKVVNKYNIGYVIKSIYDINNICLDDYDEKRKNVIALGNKIRTGFFTRVALERAIKIVKTI